jgi:hypothetical protein
MKFTLKTGLAVLAILICIPLARAQDPHVLFDGCQWTFPSLRALWQQRKCWCPDDYCTKAAPCVRPGPAGCVDDYCPKKLPCVPANPKGCVDDYCAKTCPIVLGTNCEPWYTCGPPPCCVKCGSGKRAP